MKQHITKKQFEEIIGRVGYVGEWYNTITKKDKFVLPTIGQMIKFLGDNWITCIYDIDKSSREHYPQNKDLCNKLWETVKNKLANNL